MTMGSNQTEPLYCGKGINDFHAGYYVWHGYVSLFVCILGIIANTLNIIVLTRREMRSPTNAILTGLAIADLTVMIDYIPFAFHGNILPSMNYPREKQLTYSWACFVKFHSIFAQTCHTISIWLTVTLAVWRYIAVVFPQKNRLWCGMQTTILTIATAFVVCPLITIPPIYIGFSITPFNEMLDSHGNKLVTSVTDFNTTISSTLVPPEGRNVTLYKVSMSQLARDYPFIMNSNFFIYSVLIKLIPCFALTMLSVRLIAALLEAKRRRKQLTSNSNGMKHIVNGKVVDKPRKNSKTLEKEKQTDRTTKMLLAVLLLFLMTEFPQGILGLLSATLGDPFFEQCYIKLGEVMDILALINSGINFILYCAMSRQFRTTFVLLFRPKFLDKWLPVAQDDDNGRTDMGHDNNGHTQTQVSHV
ncbi:G-protein coupled receptor dmsr-1-like [Episyrphus balteatus]|uniref:G-protein coupled receptor dmsr-1-like n=1 Tax=Episyrphus balteatus TaxID=286459 RepID=UPI0024860839|nr:G-protein coupled receptor dmsr-1-like [Episyrphus balteatus]